MGLLAPATRSALRLGLRLDVGGDACLGVLLVLGHGADRRQVDKSGLSKMKQSKGERLGERISVELVGVKPGRWWVSEVGDGVLVLVCQLEPD
jgi:hypothetical protein